MQYDVPESSRPSDCSEAQVRVSEHELWPPVVQSIAQKGIAPASGTSSVMHFPVHDDPAAPDAATLVEGSTHESFGALLHAATVPNKKRRRVIEWRTVVRRRPNMRGDSTR